MLAFSYSYSTTLMHRTSCCHSLLASQTPKKTENGDLFRTSRHLGRLSSRTMNPFHSLGASRTFPPNALDPFQNNLPLTHRYSAIHLRCYTLSYNACCTYITVRSFIQTFIHFLFQRTRRHHLRRAEIALTELQEVVVSSFVRRHVTLKLTF